MTIFESDFPSVGEIKKGESLFELHDRVVFDGLTEVQKEALLPVDPSRSNLFPSDKVTLELALRKNK